MDDWICLVDEEISLILLGHEVIDGTNAEKASVDKQVHQLNAFPLLHVQHFVFLNL